MIQEARYTSPGGKEIIFGWETAKRDTELKTGVFTFPGRDGTNVQHQGAGARTFPLVCIFSGADYMAKADEFEAMLIERGAAELQHPVYGTIKVKPVGRIEREDDPVNKLGQSTVTVTVTFTETIAGEAAAELNETAAAAIDEEYEEFSEAAAADFAAALETENISEQMDITASLETQTQSIIDNLEPIAASGKEGFADWAASAKELKDNIKNLYSKAKRVAARAESVYVKALNTGRLTLRLMKLPSTIAVSLAEKIKGYSTLTANLINQYKNDPFGAEKIKAAYATATLALTGTVAAIASGSALTVAETAAMTGATSMGIVKNTNMSIGTMSREEAIKTSGQISALLESTDAFKDEKVAAIKINGEDARAAAQTVDNAMVFAGETAAKLEESAASGIPPAVMQYVNELINSKNDTIDRLKESLGKPAGISAQILEDAIVFEKKKREQIQAAGGGNVDQILRIIRLVQ
jgi:hypothetical protein